MIQRTRLIALTAAALAVPAILSGCAASSGSSGNSDSVSVVGFSVMKTANERLIAAFQRTDEGKGVKFTTSYGASGDQARAVIGGLHADEVHFSLEPDMAKLVDSGDVSKDWNQNATDGILTDSIVVFLVRKGNPLGIKTWEDLTKPGVKVVTPNPESSGSAKWNLLAAWAHAAHAPGGSDAKAEQFVTKLLENTIAMPASGNDAMASFLAGNGDVLVAYENDSIASRAAGNDVDYVIPDDTLLIENPAAVTTDATPAAKDFLDFQLSKEGQTLYAKAGFRPVIDGVQTEVPGAEDPSDPYPTVKTLYTLNDDFGGWPEADPKYFGEDTGLISKIIAGLNIGG